MVTKQEQLEWLALNIDDFFGCDVVHMSTHLIGEKRMALDSKYHAITREEWQQERDKMQKQQDNSWHERGELPPAGSIVTVANDYETHDISDYSRDCIDAECVVMAVFERDNGVDKVKIVCVMEPYGGCYCFSLSMIRPLRTEREKAIEEMIKVAHSAGCFVSADSMASLYDAGYRKEQAK